MHQDDVNFLKMTETALAVLKKDQVIWKDEPEIVSEVASIETDYNKVMAMGSTTAGLTTTGYTKAKNITLSSILDDTLLVCKAMRVYARRNRNSVILDLVNHSPSSLSKGIEIEVINRCKAIAQEAQKNLPALLGFKVTQAGLDTIMDNIAVYSEQVEGRSTTKTEKTTTNDNIPVSISSIRHSFEILDDLVDLFIDDEGAVARYNNSRLIVNYGTSKTAPNKKNSSDTNDSKAS